MGFFFSSYSLTCEGGGECSLINFSVQDLHLVAFDLRSVPGKRVFPVSISAMMHPTDHMSTKREQKKFHV